MKITIVGVGAVGGLIGTRLAAAGEVTVSALARGRTLQALREHGWRLRDSQGLLQAPAVAHDRAEPLGVQDVVMVAVKAPALRDLAPSLAPLIGPHTLIVPAMNGVPWWFCAQLPGFAAQPLRSVDPDGALMRALPLPQVVGCVVHVSAATPEPGLVDHRMGRGLILGLADTQGARTPALERLAAALKAAGFDTTLSPDIRHDIWFKLWGNLTMNPITALTGATMDRVLADPLLRAFCTQAMAEAARIGARIGCPIDQTPEDRHAITARLGAVKTSMLQDVEAGRAIELDAIVGAVHEIGERVGEPAPAISALLGLTRLMGRERGLYPPAAAV